MTKIEEIEQKLNEWLKTVSKEEMIKILEEEGFEVIDKESKKEGKWKPKDGDEYHYRKHWGGFDYYIWEDTDTDNYMYNNIPIFKTKKECERYWHFMDTVKEKSYEFTELDWKNDEIKKYTIYYNFFDGKFNTTNISDSKFLGEIYFKSKEDAQYIIDNFKDELMEFFV